MEKSWNKIETAPKDREIIVSTLSNHKHLVLWCEDKWLDRYSYEVEDPILWMEYAGDKIKTRIMWEQSKLDYDKFFFPGDQIDEAAYLYLLEIVPQRFSCERNGVLFDQAGECQDEVNGVKYYETFYHVRNPEKYVYLGAMPKFKQAKF